MRVCKRGIWPSLRHQETSPWRCGTSFKIWRRSRNLLCFDLRVKTWAGSSWLILNKLIFFSWDLVSFIAKCKTVMMNLPPKEVIKTYTENYQGNFSVKLGLQWGRQQDWNQWEQAVRRLQVHWPQGRGSSWTWQGRNDFFCSPRRSV